MVLATHVMILLTSLAGLVTAVVTLCRQAATHKSVNDVHTVVNQQYTDMVRREQSLVAALTEAGVDVPPAP